MKFGLVIATKIEIEVALNKFKNIKKIETSPFSIYKIDLEENKELIIINSGVGNTLSAIATTFLLNNYDIDYLFNYGVVGAVNENLSLSQIVLIDEVFDFGFDTDPIDHKGIGYHEELTSLELKSDESLLSLASSLTNLPILKLGSSNKFIENQDEKKEIYSNFKVDVVDMEGFGFISSTKLFKKPALLIKGVSDAFLDGSSSYQKKASEVASLTFDILLKIINKL